MRSIIYAESVAELQAASTAGLREVILAPQSLSRRGTLTWPATQALEIEARRLNLLPVLEWDALMTESRFIACVRDIEKHAAHFQVFRVRDAGAAQWLKTHRPSAKLQLLLEAGHHNLPALQSWQARLGEALQRFCLSPELPAQTLRRWRPLLTQEIEVLGLGPLLLFHSGRPLLSSLESAPEGEELTAEGASEESPHKGFILQENSHGTLMFHPKDLSLLERWADLQEAGIDIVRLDHRQQADKSILSELLHFTSYPTETNAAALKARWEREWMRGYFDVNKSDVLFDKLKNNHLRQRDGETLGEILEGKRDGWLAVLAKGAGLKRGQRIQVMDPKGHSSEQTVFWLKDAGFGVVDELPAGQVGFIPWFAGAPAKTTLIQLDIS